MTMLGLNIITMGPEWPGGVLTALFQSVRTKDTCLLARNPYKIVRGLSRGH